MPDRSNATVAGDNTKQDLFGRLCRELENPPFNAWLAPTPLHAEATGTAISLKFRPELSYHPTEAIFHGGVIAALIDIAGYVSVAIVHDHATPTAGLSIEFLAPAAGTELTARTALRKVGRSLARVDIDVLVGSRLVAIGRGTFSTGGSSR